MIIELLLMLEGRPIGGGTGLEPHSRNMRPIIVVIFTGGALDAKELANVDAILQHLIAPFKLKGHCG